MSFVALAPPPCEETDTRPARSRSIASHLVLLCIAVAFPVLIGVSAAVWRYADAERRKLENRGIASAREISELLDIDILSLTAVLRTLANSSRLPTNDHESFYRSALEVSQQTGLDVVLSDVQGHVILSSNHPLGTVLPDVEPNIRKVIETKEPVVTDLIRDSVSQTASYAIAAPVFRRQTDEVSHVLHFNINTQRIRDILLRSIGAQDVRASVIDRSGRILARSPNSDTAQGVLWQGFERAGQEKEGVFRHHNLHGVESLTSFTHMRSTGWLVVHGVDAEVVDGPIRALVWQIIGLAGLIALIAGVIGLVLSRRLLASLRMLETTPMLETNRIGGSLAHSSSDLQQTPAAREALLYEVNHRVKNSLAAVTSILSMQARQTSDAQEKRALSVLRSRIDIIARIHQSLYESGRHNSVNVGDFLKEVATTTLQTLDSQRTCELNASVDSDVIMPVYRTTPLAFIAAELITNALKHAQKTDAPCKITMRFARDGDHGLSLLIADDGVGLDASFDPLLTEGVGMRIVTCLLQQLRATMTTNAGKPGARFLIILDEAHGE